MYMRFLRLSVKPNVEIQFQQFYKTIVINEIQKMDGCRLAVLIKNSNEEGQFISLTLWDEKHQAEFYEKSKVFAILSDQSKHFLFGSNEWKVQLSEDLQLEYKSVSDKPVKKDYFVAAISNSNIVHKENSPGMYVRIVSAKIQEGKTSEFKDLYSAEIIPILRATTGCHSAYLSESMNHKNEFLSITIWDDKSSADEYEAGGQFDKLVAKVKHTFSQFYLWKVALEQESNDKIQTSDDLKIDHYTMVTGKSFN